MCHPMTQWAAYLGCIEHDIKARDSRSRVTEVQTLARQPTSLVEYGTCDMSTSWDPRLVASTLRTGTAQRAQGVTEL